MTSAPPIGFEYRGSRLLMLALLLVVVLAMAAVLMAELPAWLAGVLLAAAGSTAGVGMAGLMRPRIQRLLWRTDGSVRVCLRDSLSGGSREIGARLQDAHVLGPLITLKLGWAPHGRATVWLWPDNLDADTRRQLRVRIRGNPEL